MITEKPGSEYVVHHPTTDNPFTQCVITVGDASMAEIELDLFSSSIQCVVRGHKIIVGGLQVDVERAKAKLRARRGVLEITWPTEVEIKETYPIVQDEPLPLEIPSNSSSAASPPTEDVFESTAQQSDSDEEPPPLEDISEKLARCRVGNAKPASNSRPISINTPCVANNFCVSEEGAEVHHEETPQEMMTRIGMEQKKKRQAETERSRKEASGFSGLKKGFFTSSPSATKPPKKEVVPYITPKKDTGSALDSLKNVVKKPSGLQGITKPEIDTTKFAKLLQENPALLKRMTDPALSEAMERIRKDPSCTDEECRKNPDLKQLLELLGVKQYADSRLDEWISRQAPEVQRRLQDPLIKPLIKDEGVRALIARARRGENIDKELSTNPDLQRKVQTLVQSGALELMAYS